MSYLPPWRRPEVADGQPVEPVPEARPAAVMDGIAHVHLSNSSTPRQVPPGPCQMCTALAVQNAHLRQQLAYLHDLLAQPTEVDS